MLVAESSETTRNHPSSNNIFQRPVDQNAQVTIMKSKTPKFQKSPKPWKTLGGRKLIDLGEVKLFRDRIESKSGFRTHHLRLSLHDFSIIVPVLDDNRVVFIWNYRHPIQGWELELPAGLIDPGETPQTG